MINLEFWVTTPTGDLLISCEEHLKFNRYRYSCPLCLPPDAPFINSYTKTEIKKHLKDYHHLDVKP